MRSLVHGVECLPVWPVICVCCIHMLCVCALADWGSGSCSSLASIGLSVLVTPNIKSLMVIVLIEGLVPCPMLNDVQLQVKLYLCFSGRKLKNVNAKRLKPGRCL